MTKKKSKAQVAAIKDMRNEFEPLKELTGFAYYKEWRSIIFNMFRQVIDQGDTKKGQAMSQLADHCKDLSVLIETGFFHEAYLHNFRLAIGIFVSNWKNPAEINEMLEIVDMYVAPKSAKTQSFANAMYKVGSGMFAYMLIKKTKCSERLAVFIAKQAFGFQSEQFVYEPLTKIKKYKFPDGKIPLAIKLLVFILLHLKTVDWQSLKPRAKQERSISELAMGLNYIAQLRQTFAEEEIKTAKHSFNSNPAQFADFIKPDYAERLLNFGNGNDHLDDDLTCAILFASYCGNDMSAALMSHSN